MLTKGHSQPSPNKSSPSSVKLAAQQRAWSLPGTTSSEEQLLFKGYKMSSCRKKKNPLMNKVHEKHPSGLKGVDPHNKVHIQKALGVIVGILTE